MNKPFAAFAGTVRRIVRSLLGIDEIIVQQKEIIKLLKNLNRCTTGGYGRQRHSIRTASQYD